MLNLGDFSEAFSFGELTHLCSKKCVRWIEGEPGYGEQKARKRKYGRIYRQEARSFPASGSLFPSSEAKR